MVDIVRPIQLTRHLPFRTPEGSARLVLLLFSPGPVDISWTRDSAGVDAILYCGLPGSATGGAIWRILTRTGRKSSPAARLPFTWPAKMDQVSRGMRMRQGPLKGRI